MRLGALTVSQKARVIRLVVGSENKAKLSAVQKACSRMFSHLKRQQQLKSNHNRNTHADTDEDEDEDDNVKLEIHGFAVPSGVSDQPMSDLETMTGAKNRAKATLEAARAMNLIPEEEEEDASISVFSIGIEGGIEKVGDHYFECGWVAVIDATSGKMGLGTSGRFELSSVLMQGILEQGEELGTVMDRVSGEVDVKKNAGAMGLLTAGLLNRDAAYDSGIIFAFAPFISDQKYWN